jgi:hypothetical protein
MGGQQYWYLWITKECGILDRLCGPGNISVTSSILEFGLNNRAWLTSTPFLPTLCDVAELMVFFTRSVIHSVFLYHNFASFFSHNRVTL